MTSKFSIDNRELLQRISSGEAVVGIDFGNLIVRELAAFRLAAMNGEPVAWLRESAITYTRENAWEKAWAPILVMEADRKTANLSESWGMSYIPLYRHAQPAPEEVKGSDELYDVIDDDGDVVLSAISFNEAQTESDGYNGENLHIVRHEAQLSPVVPDERDKTVDADDHPLLWSFNEGWNACRAAMLNGGKP